MRFLALLALAVLMLPQLSFAQGATSAILNGFVVDSEGKGVPNATVVATHDPTNARFTTVTGPNGRFNFPAVPVGGPFTITANADALVAAPLKDVGTVLGESTDVVLVAASSEVVQLEKFVVETSTSELDANTFGQASVLSSARIVATPTSSRSFADLIKQNPFVAVRAFPQVSALGMNNRYNSITLDGARLNDQFGLASSGLLSLKNPFSLDAIEQFSVAITPMDVTESGFAGASINAVSKSGTNRFSGSAYVLYTSHKWQGTDVSGSNFDRRPTPFIERTTGFTFGGPIIKNRLFFFMNYEKVDNPQGSPANAGFNPSTEFLSWLDSQIDALPGAPDLGSWGNAPATVEKDRKRLLKLDWNINSQHRLTLRYSDTEGERPNFNAYNPGTGFSSTVVPPGTSATGYSNGITSLSSSFYNLSVLEEVWAAQLFSNWTPSFSTELSFSKNDSSSLRTTPAIFPEIRIFNVPGTANTTAGTPITTGNAFTFGTELSSMGNGIITEGLNYKAVGNYIWRNFTFKAGVDYEETDFDNLFRAGSYGVFGYTYSPGLNLATATPTGFARGVAQEGFPGTDVSKFEQNGYFAQALWQPNQRLAVTFGLRFDEFGSPIAPPSNAKFSTDFNGFYPGIRNDATIDGSSRLAPRLSFNYALEDERTTQIRGALGVVVGRNPWVWLSNSYGNAGYGRYTVTMPRSGVAAPTLSQYLQGNFVDTDPAFKFDPENPLGTTNLAPTSTSTVTINMVEPGLELPTNLRGSLAIDRRIPALDAIFTIEYVRNDVMKAMFYDNLNLRVLNGTATNAPTAASYGADGRLRFAGSASSAPLVTGYGNVLRLRNVDVGHSDYVSFMLDRPMKNGWAYNLAYTRGRAREAQPAGSSTASSNWNFNIVFNQGEVELARADYEVRDRVQFSFSKEFRYLKRYKSTITLYYEGRSGQPFSYVYSGDLNRDGNSNNDLVAVPTGASDPRFDFSQMPNEEQSAYFNFIGSSGLGKYAGGYAPRNAFLTPWQNRLDLRFSQEVRTYKSVTVELFADFINFGSWVSKGLFNYIEEINTSTTNSNQFRALGSAAYTADGKIRPSLTSVSGRTLDANGNLQFASSSQIVANNGDSRWRIQGGVRLKF